MIFYWYMYYAVNVLSMEFILQFTKGVNFRYNIFYVHCEHQLVSKVPFMNET